MSDSPSRLALPFAQRDPAQRGPAYSKTLSSTPVKSSSAGVCPDPWAVHCSPGGAAGQTALKSSCTSAGGITASPTSREEVWSSNDSKYRYPFPTWFRCRQCYTGFSGTCVRELPSTPCRPLLCPPFSPPDVTVQSKSLLEPLCCCYPDHGSSDSRYDFTTRVFGYTSMLLYLGLVVPSQTTLS
jgi:hypothetical protein